MDELDLTAFHTPYEGDGRRNAPYEPRTMVKVLLYGYATGVFPPRGIAGRPEEDVAFRVLGTGNLPGHCTLCGFRRRHLEDFRGLFVEAVRVARRMGLAHFGKLSVDGTKVRANASKRKATGCGATRGGAEQFHRPRQCHHEDKLGGVPAVLQHAGGRGRRTSVDCRDGTDLERK